MKLLEACRQARACLLNLQPDEPGPMRVQMQKMIGELTDAIEGAACEQVHPDHKISICPSTARDHISNIIIHATDIATHDPAVLNKHIPEFAAIASLLGSLRLRIINTGFQRGNTQVHLFEQAVINLIEYHECLVNQTLVANFEARIAWPDSGDAQRDYENIRDQVESMCEDYESQFTMDRWGMLHFAEEEVGDVDIDDIRPSDRFL